MSNAQESTHSAALSVIVLCPRLGDYFTPYNRQLQQEWGLDFAWLR